MLTVQYLSTGGPGNLVMWHFNAVEPNELWVADVPPLCGRHLLLRAYRLLASACRTHRRRAFLTEHWMANLHQPVVYRPALGNPGSGCLHRIQAALPPRSGPPRAIVARSADLFATIFAYLYKTLDCHVPPLRTQNNPDINSLLKELHHNARPHPYSRPHKPHWGRSGQSSHNIYEPAPFEQQEPQLGCQSDSLQVRADSNQRSSSEGAG